MQGMAAGLQLSVQNLSMALQRTLWQGNLHGRVYGKGASLTGTTPRFLQDVRGQLKGAQGNLIVEELGAHLENQALGINTREHGRSRQHILNKGRRVNYLDIRVLDGILLELLYPGCSHQRVSMMLGVCFVLCMG